MFGGGGGGFSDGVVMARGHRPAVSVYSESRGDSSVPQGNASQATHCYLRDTMRSEGERQAEVEWPAR